MSENGERGFSTVFTLMAYWSDWSITGLALEGNVKTNSKDSIASRTRTCLLGARKRQEKKHMYKVKGRICYTCMLKKHLSQDCSKSNKFAWQV
jgi:hypothetical protein